MTHDQPHHDHTARANEGFWTSRAFLVFLGFAAVALILLWEEHRAHMLGALPYLFLLACPLMHIFMHGGHGHGGHGRHRQHERTGGPPSNTNGGPS